MVEYSQEPHAIPIKQQSPSQITTDFKNADFQSYGLPHGNLSQNMSQHGMAQLNQQQFNKFQQQQAPQSQSRSSTHAEKRANHNAIERARRESLNIRFLELAQSIPSLVHVRKPSKSIIVSRSIEFITETKQRLDVKTRSLTLLRQQNDEFKQEINRLRSKLGMGSVVFPDNIDLDLVFEANLEHQKELETRNPSSQAAMGYSTYRGGSPFDMINTTNLDSDDERRGPYSASVLSPLTIGDRDDSYRPHSGNFNNLIQAGVSSLSNSLQDMKPIYYQGFGNGQPTPPTSLMSPLGMEYGSYQGQQFMNSSWNESVAGFEANQGFMNSQNVI